MKLKNYTPAKNEILLELKHYAEHNGVIMPNPQAEKVMRVLKVGPTVDVIKPGDFVLMNDRMMAQIPLDDENGKKIICVQGQEFNVMGTYTPDPDETKIYVPIVDGPKPEEMPGPKNIIDNPGIDSAPFLKEQAEFQKNLD